MRLPTAARLPLSLPELVRRLTGLWFDAAQQVNALSEGRITAATNADTAAPTTGVWHAGDVVRNSAPAEAGTAGSKYVITGWLCVASGEPGTWVEQRCLTGN